MSPTLRIEPSEPAELHYHVLAHLDLGRDAASIHDPAIHSKAWTGSLLAAYRAAPGRLALQFSPLFARSVDELIRGLESAPLRRTEDPADRQLRLEMARALAAEREGLGFSLVARTMELVPLVHPLLDALEPLRAALWRQSRDSPPSLRLLHCPPLGPHARATSRGRERVVATNLLEPLDHVVCQIFHEETHAVSDPGVRAAPLRDTRAGSPGHSAHMELEWAAVELGQRVLEAEAPALLAAYRQWRRRFRME